MSLQTVLLALLVVLFGTAQYTLMVQALRDLARRTRVRGDNKVLWGIVILTVPIAGALLYSWMGPTSLRRRDAATIPSRSIRRTAAGPDLHSNVTSINAARNRRERIGATKHQRVPHPPVERTRSGAGTDLRRYERHRSTPRPPRTGS